MDANGPVPVLPVRSTYPIASKVKRIRRAAKRSRPVASATSDPRAKAGAEKLLWYITSNKVPPHIANPPGYIPVSANVQMLRGAEHPMSAFGKRASVESAIETGIMFAGTPDQVLKQIQKHYDHVGGYGHILIMGQAGFLEHDDTVHGIRMFAREVYPQLRELYPHTVISGFPQPAVRAKAEAGPPEVRY